jgi:hypothetical protein
LVRAISCVVAGVVVVTVITNEVLRLSSGKGRLV